jgi:hypothetical protein
VGIDLTLRIVSLSRRSFVDERVVYCRGGCRRSRAEGQIRNVSRNRTMSTRRLWEHGMNQGLSRSDAVDEEVVAVG